MERTPGVPATNITVHLHDGSRLNARLVGRDPATDLSVLKVSAGGRKLPVAPLGNSDALRIGEWVVAIGNPLGLTHSVTAGIVSAKGRRQVNPDGRLKYPDFIQTDASINPGNSGGPLFNLRGEVVGINTAIHRDGQGIGFAIPINMVKTLVPMLVRDGRVARSWLGVSINEVTQEHARSFALDRPRGALVSSLAKDGPAALGGITAGDIIVAFDGQAIDRWDDLPWLASTAGIGKRVPLRVLRDSRTRTVEVTLGRLPGEKAPPSQDVTRESALGMTIGEVPPQVSRTHGIKGGALISAVEPGSVAARAGVKKGDIVIRHNNVPIHQPHDLVLRLRDTTRDEVHLLIQREKGRTFIALDRSTR